ncbi:MAG: molybdopterin adenylyltransferase [Phaeodactylibacter sp.]|nr:molybdopterin adenylyltransferase [Phaeodactylibacter sp.]
MIILPFSYFCAVLARIYLRFKKSTGVEKAIIGIINVSDRASRGEYEDLPGKEVRRLMGLWLTSPFETAYAVIPDEQDQLEEAMIDMADQKGCALIVTTGGTGPAPRDVTPEATIAVCEKMLPGFGEQMRQVSLQYVPTAILSRQTAGVRGSTLIVNLPGKPKSIRECLEAVFPAIPYCIDLIGGAYLETNPEEMKVFRPGQRK